MNRVYAQEQHNSNFYDGIKGSVSIEAALCSVLISIVFILMLSILQYVYIYYAATNAALKAAQELSCYSSLLHESGLDSLSDTVKNRLLQKTGVYDNETLAPMASIANHAFDLIDASVYNAALKTMISDYLCSLYESGELLFPIETVSLLGSKYFEDGSGFSLNLTCRSKFIMPIPFVGAEGCSVNVCVNGNGWMSAGTSKYSAEDIEVWGLSNFKRGKVLEEVFGSNLPYDFPVADIYNKEEKSITAILSIDHTKDKYIKKGALSETIMKEAKELIGFCGAEAGGVSIKETDYMYKKLLIIMPLNSLSPAQSIETATAAAYCNTKGIDVEFEYYQTSNHSS